MLRLHPFASLFHYPTCGFKLIGLPVDYTVIQGKAIPLQAWTGPEGSRMLRLPHFIIIIT